MRRPGREFPFRPCRRQPRPSRRPCGFGTKTEPAGRLATPAVEANNHTIRGSPGTVRQIRIQRPWTGSRTSGNSSSRPGYSHSSSCSGCCRFRCRRSRCYHSRYRHSRCGCARCCHTGCSCARCCRSGCSSGCAAPNTVAAVTIAPDNIASVNIVLAAEAPATEVPAA
jgi:hypothetical protein